MTTDNFSLNQPASGARGWNAPINDNLDTISNSLLDIREKDRQALIALGSVDTSSFIPRGYNMGFDIWQRGTSFTTDGYGPDMWELAITNTPILTREDGDDFNNTYVASLALGAGDEAELINNVPYKPTLTDFYKFCRSKVVTFSIDVRADIAANVVVKAVVRDGIGETEETSGGGDTVITRLTVVHTVDSAATKLEVVVSAGATGSAIVDIGNAAFAVGDFSSLIHLPYIPLHPQDDIYGCSAIYQKMEVDFGYYDKSTTVDWKHNISYPCPMLATPTATVDTGGGASFYGGGTFSPIEFIPENNLSGYLHAVHTGAYSADSAGAAGVILELEV